jgi:hypothetical protein
VARGDAYKSGLAGHGLLYAGRCQSRHKGIWKIL